MKKIALILSLSFLTPFFPSKAMATPVPTGGASVGVVVGLGLLALSVFDGPSASAKAGGSEFEKLNNQPAFPGLLKQTAGGSLNTLQILN